VELPSRKQTPIAGIQSAVQVAKRKKQLTFRQSGRCRSNTRARRIISFRSNRDYLLSLSKATRLRARADDIRCTSRGFFRNRHYRSPYPSIFRLLATNHSLWISDESLRHCWIIREYHARMIPAASERNPQTQTSSLSPLRSLQTPSCVLIFFLSRRLNCNRLGRSSKSFSIIPVIDDPVERETEERLNPRLLLFFRGEWTVPYGDYRAGVDPENVAPRTGDY